MRQVKMWRGPMSTAIAVLVAAVLAISVMYVAPTSATTAGTWTARTAAEDNGWFSVTYGNGLFVAVSLSHQVMTSPDGVTWTARTAAEANQWKSVTYGNGLFVAVSQAGAHQVMTSGAIIPPSATSTTTTTTNPSKSTAPNATPVAAAPSFTG